MDLPTGTKKRMDRWIHLITVSSIPKNSSGLAVAKTVLRKAALVGSTNHPKLPKNENVQISLS